MIAEIGGAAVIGGIAGGVGFTIRYFMNRDRARTRAQDADWNRFKSRLTAGETERNVLAEQNKEAATEIYGMAENTDPAFTVQPPAYAREVQRELSGVVVTAEEASAEPDGMTGDDTAWYIDPDLVQGRAGAALTGNPGTWDLSGSKMAAPADLIERLPKGDWLRSLLLSAENMHVRALAS